MVERPIKKSERQSQDNTDSKPKNLDSKPLESNPKRSKRNDDRSGRGKKRDFKDESKPPVNPALARGPKPVKPQPKDTIEPETDTEAVSAESQDETQGETAEG
jgi:hypothetical protein